MTEFIKSDADRKIYTLHHDLKNCLHVISIGMELLKSARHDEARFREICENIEHERRSAAKLLGELLKAFDEARDGNRN